MHAGIHMKQHTEFFHNPVFQSKASAVALKACTHVGGYKKGLFVYVSQPAAKSLHVLSWSLYQGW